MTDGVKRPYDSTRRREQAAENRTRVLRAAHDLFVQRGYGHTTVADVAGAAGVAVETIYSTFRNKPALLRRAWDLAVGGDEQDIALVDRPEMRALFDEPDLTARLTAFAGVHTTIMRRTAPLRLAVLGAAASEPVAARMLAEIDAARYDAMARHAGAAAATGQLAVTEDECRDVLWSTTDGSLWHNLVVSRGWSDGRYAGWLGGFWVSVLATATRPRR